MGPLPGLARVTARDQSRTQDIGTAIGRMAEPGDLLLLTGELGAGKTCLTQGIANGLGVTERVFSPTFVLVREYQGRFPLYHMDFYRLEKLQEISDLGLDDYLFGKGVCAIEWAERGLALMPGERLLIEISYLTDTARRLSFTATGDRYLHLLNGIKSNTEDLDWNFLSTPPQI
jgi:tRNA threonylcarbamoyladenosine biosynthesis protein TsaE